VGEGETIKRRLADHEQKFWFKRPIVEKGSYLVVREKSLRRQIEKVLIKFLKSNAVLNTQHVERQEVANFAYHAAPQRSPLLTASAGKRTARLRQAQRLARLIKSIVLAAAWCVVMRQCERKEMIL
jgi:hypothetical protein